MTIIVSIGTQFRPITIPIRFQIFHSSDEVREQSVFAQANGFDEDARCCTVVQVLSDCQLVEIEGWQDRTNLVLRGIKPDEFWESEICSLSPSFPIYKYMRWPHPQDGKVALFARVRDVRLQERKGIANPFYDIGDGARAARGCALTMAYYDILRLNMPPMPPMPLGITGATWTPGCVRWDL